MSNKSRLSTSFLISLLLIGFLCGLLVVPVFADSLYEYYDVGDTAVQSCRGIYWNGLNFTASSGHTISVISLYGYRLGYPGVINASLRLAGSDFKPTGSILSSGTFNGSTLGTSSAWFNISITEYAITEGTKYAISIDARNGNDANYFGQRRNETASVPYNGLYSGDSGATWSLLTRKYLFRIYGNSLEIPCEIVSTIGTNTTLTARTWLFHSQWFIPSGSLSGFIFSSNASGSMANNTWVAFADTNNSWANVSKSISNNLATVIQWTVYANGSTNLWGKFASIQNVSTTAQLTCYYGAGGSVRVNGTNMGNGTALTYTLATSVANLGALSSNASYGFLNFTWSDGLSGSSATNSYNLTLYNCTTLWAYFQFHADYVQACFNFTPSNPKINETVTFDATSSVSSAAILNYTWNFGDGNTSSGAAYSVIYHTYTGNDSYLITLTVGRSLGNSSLSLGLVVGWGGNHTCVSPGGGGSFGWGAIVLILLIPSLIVVLVLIRRRR